MSPLGYSAYIEYWNKHANNKEYLSYIELCLFDISEWKIQYFQ